MQRVQGEPCHNFILIQLIQFNFNARRALPPPALAAIPQTTVVTFLILTLFIIAFFFFTNYSDTILRKPHREGVSEKGLEASQDTMQGLQGAILDIMSQWNYGKTGLIQGTHIPVVRCIKEMQGHGLNSMNKYRK